MTLSSVPDTDALRRAALQASWRRGRWVAWRRLAWRWTAWASVRIGLPVLLFVAAVAAATPWVARLADDTPRWMSAAPPALVKTPVAAASPRLPAAASATTSATATATVPVTAPTPIPTPSIVDPSAQTAGAAPVESSRPPGAPGLRLDLNLPAAKPADPAPPTTNVGDNRP